MNMNDFQEALFTLGEKAGFQDMEIYYDRKEEFSCQLFEEEVDSYKTSEVAGVSFRGLYEGKMGYAYTEKLDEDSLPFLIEHAKESAVFSEDAAEEIFSGSKQYEKASFYHTELSKVTIEDKINLLKAIDQSLKQQDERIIGTNYFQLASTETERMLINTKGLLLREKQNDIGIYLSVVAKQGDEIKTGTYAKFTQDFQSLNPEDIAKYAANEAISKFGGKSFAGKKYPVLLRHDAAASLLSTFSPIFSAENVQKGQSLLKDKEGSAVAVPTVNLIDDPFLKGGLNSRSFDSEGVATKKQAVVKDGKLVTLLYNLKTAKAAGTDSTGHGYRPSYKGTLSVAPTNFYIVPSEKKYEDLVSSVEEGVLITDLSGLHSGADAASGEFSVAANGYYLKNGKMEAAKQMTIAGNFYELLQNIEQIGSDLHFSPSFVAPGFYGSPSLIVKGLSVTVE
ncbi:TldD/PmbA family protein [Bacillaceae bacterium Marseille-Q3522]|nr:TldD/PmbA family protein [Bacillaceae bacterium Marseille-Q3522]